jgi:dienelactone hydrolase
VQSTNAVYFNLFLPAGPEPAGGWPVVIAGHGAGGKKDTGNIPIRIAAKFAEHGLATLAPEIVGHGGGPLGTLTVNKTDGTTVTLPSGGRGVDVNGDHKIATTGIGEGLLTAPNSPDAIVLARDGLRQTAVDPMQLTREIQVCIDVNGDSSPDLDPSRIYYFGNSLGGIYGADFVALDPAIRAAVLGAAGGSIVEAARLNSAGPFRGLLGQLLAAPARTPSLVNLPPGSPDPINSANTQLPVQREPPPTGPCTTREHHSRRDRDPGRDRPNRIGGTGLRPGSLRLTPAPRTPRRPFREAHAPHLRPGRPGHQ